MRVLYFRKKKQWKVKANRGFLSEEQNCPN
jgi:lipopolysaccharide export system protein LptC